MRFLTSFGMTNKVINNLKLKYKMKKKLLATAFIMMMVCGANAQGRDGFFSNWDNGIGTRDMTDPTPGALPAAPTADFGTDDNSTAPLGSGLLVLTALGAGYAVYRKRNK